MKIGVIGAGTMGQGIAKAFAQVEGNTVALCDIKQEWACLLYTSDAADDAFRV